MNALGAVAGAGIMVIPVLFGVRFFAARLVTVIVDKDDMIGANGIDGEAVAGKNARGLDRLVGLGRGPKRDVVGVSEVVAASAGVVVIAAFGGRGTI